MGKISMVVVIGFAAIVGIVGTTMNKRTTEAQRNNSSLYEKTQARNIAKSAAEIYARELRKNPNLSGSTEMSLLGGTATVGISEKTPGKREKLGFNSEGRYGATTRTVGLDAMDDNSWTPPVSGALGISYLSKAKIKLGKDAVIDGRNYDINGNLSGAFPDVAGISIGHPLQVADLEYNLKEVKIKGKGLVEPNIETQLPQRDYYKWAMELAKGADATHSSKKFGDVTFGTAANPQVTYVKGNTKFDGKLTGHGILIIEGKATFSEKIDWRGLVFCVADSLTPEKANIGGKGSKIIGAVMVAGKKTNVKIGDVDLLYSHQAINMAYGLVANRMGRRYAFLNWRG